MLNRWLIFETSGVEVYKKRKEQFLYMGMCAVCNMATGNMCDFISNIGYKKSDEQRSYQKHLLLILIVQNFGMEILNWKKREERNWKLAGSNRMTFHIFISIIFIISLYSKKYIRTAVNNVVHKTVRVVDDAKDQTDHKTLTITDTTH